jgi:hypothetical protein
MSDSWRSARMTTSDSEPAEPPSEEFVRDAQAELYELSIAGRAPN